MPDACVVRHDPRNGTIVSREVWFFDRSVKISPWVVAEWIALHTQDQIACKQNLGYFSQPPKWKQTITDCESHGIRTLDTGHLLNPNGLNAYELRVYDHQLLHQFIQDQVQMRYMVWSGDCNLPQ
ncbi:hypothetical protein BDV93DRAFT_230572 [Ceratobasidium sp. AG-I]|nr:hypothetical protein BDV93DRAFT_230572 [Ceratobasidium sp. AG-I]